MESIPKLTAKAQKVFNAWIRRRDSEESCISCGKPGNQAGHYFTVKGFNYLRFDERNVNLQCSGCNFYKYGNQAMYRIGLVRKLGEEVVQDLEFDAVNNRVKKWTRTELLEIIEKYKP